MEDVPEDDRDIKLQKVSGDFINDFTRSLRPFLRKPDGQIRSRVRTRETTRLTSTLLDPFQELPQLLDPHLPQWLPTLAAAYLEHVRTQSHRLTKPNQTSPASTRTELLEPLPAAICKLLYTFAKIRGPAVVLRFLPVETKNLEPLLTALESAERRAARPSLLAVTDTSRAKLVADEPSQREWTWEERYIVLLWLSHLLLAPFDLATISSYEPDTDSTLSVAGLKLPDSLPGITVRIIPLGIKYLASPGKERDGAKELLVRIAMRRDMQQLGVLDSLISWALESLQTKQDEASGQPYLYIGILSFLAGVLRSSINTSDIKKHLSRISQAAFAVSSEESPISGSVQSYAVARKMIIKVIRSVAVQILQQTPQNMEGTEIVESSVAFLLERLADNDTPVRLAASKALSVITLKLDPDMAEQVVEAVLDSLNRNVLWTRNIQSPLAKRSRDLGAVDPLEWHGLMLTLSHLLYRRSPPASRLADIIHGLLLGLSFEQRSVSGGSVGTNVRDAACFGVWAVARRYTTTELLAVPPASVVAVRNYSTDVSILQILATELIVAGCLDPAGNIRRGASAALQELIGRHPDMIDKGIWVVQTVDYHSVALRSRAIREVSLGVTNLSSQYGQAILDGLLDWRGNGDPDANARRVAASSFGALTYQMSQLQPKKALGQFQLAIQLILDRLETLQVRQVDERHGLLLSFAAVLDVLPIFLKLQDIDITRQALDELVDALILQLRPLLQDAQNTNYRRPELIAEATNKLIVSSCPILRLATARASYHEAGGEEGQPEKHSLYLSSTESLQDLMSVIRSLRDIPESVSSVVLLSTPVVSASLGRSDKEAVRAASEAAVVLLIFSSLAERIRLVESWAEKVRARPTSRTVHENGYFFALAKVYSFCHESRQMGTAGQDLVVDAFLARWTADNDIDTRVAILQSLTQSIALYDRPLAFLKLLVDGLQDYTTNARGDIGSHVRLEALRATKSIWQNLSRAQDQNHHEIQQVLFELLRCVLRLAAEKLDRVRADAQAALALSMQSGFAERFLKLTFSSRKYFEALLSTASECDGIRSLITEDVTPSRELLMGSLLAGYVTSADTGNEDLVIAARAALTTFCAKDAQNLDLVCTALVQNISEYQGQDRVLVPSLEVVAFLCCVGLFQNCATVNLRRLCLLVQKSGYKTGNVRKLEACIRVYGCLAAFEEGQVMIRDNEELTNKRREGVAEAKKRLGALLSHPWPRVRNLVVDELWMLYCDIDLGQKLKGVDWGRAHKGIIKSLVTELGLC